MRQLLAVTCLGLASVLAVVDVNGCGVDCWIPSDPQSAIAEVSDGDYGVSNTFGEIAGGRAKHTPRKPAAAKAAADPGTASAVAAVFDLRRLLQPVLVKMTQPFSLQYLTFGDGST